MEASNAKNDTLTRCISECGLIGLAFMTLLSTSRGPDVHRPRKAIWSTRSKDLISEYLEETKLVILRLPIQT